MKMELSKWFHNFHGQEKLTTSLKVLKTSKKGYFWHQKSAKLEEWKNQPIKQ